jgi:FeS assembly SUF system protein
LSIWPTLQSENDYYTLGSLMTTEQISPSEELILEALKEVNDPEIGINIVDLGLIYGTEVDATGKVSITMTLTTPACPLNEYIDAAVKTALEEVPGVTDSEVNLVWTPPWGPDKMSEDARLELGFW